LAAGSLAPWLSGFEPEALRACLTFSLPALQTWFNAAAQSRELKTGHGQTLHLVEQSALPAGCAYETYIARSGGLPTRDNLHDRFNALVWLHLPRLKAELNALQAQEIEQRGHRNNQRGAWRDWATLLDESGVLVLARQDAHTLKAAWREHDWMRVFWSSRSRWQQGSGHSSFRSDWQAMTEPASDDLDGCPAWSAWPMGHALLEKGQRPYKALTGQAWLLDISTVADRSVRLGQDRLSSWSQIDSWASTAMSLKRQREADAPQRLWPLPIMGVPGWSNDNHETAFYQDPAVFRPARALAKLNPVAA
jgi:hypothetical protein